MPPQFYIGQRLSFDGQLCTVRYVGEVKGTKGEWLGAEWDDPTRGKHSGEYGGVKYFECLSKSPTAGSFVRPTRKSDAPRSFVKALKAKYASEEVGEDPDVKIVYVWEDKSKKKSEQQSRPIKISGKEVEEVGFDKIRDKLANLNELRIVILDGLCMTRPEARLRNEATETVWPEGLTDIKDSCPKTVELDLSRNLFEEWREVGSICEQLERLRSLRVDGTRFRDTSIGEAEKPKYQSAFSGIKTLRLEDNLMPWEDIVNIATTFPILTTLFASSNALNTLSAHHLPSTITELTLEENDFRSLSDLQPLTHLPNLRRLDIKSNKISEIRSQGTSIPIFSPNLTDIDLSYNEISTWSFIDNLSSIFPGLSALRVSHNPLFQSLQAADGKPLSADDGYMLTIARLGDLKSLNYSPITHKERMNAEMYYLSLIARELTFSPDHLSAQILSQHPRYQYLCEEYGEPVIKRTDGAVNPNSLAARLIGFKFHLAQSAKTASKDAHATHSTRVLEVEVPMSFTSYTLHGIVAKHFGLKPLKIKLVWETGDWVPANQGHGPVDEEFWDSDTDDEEAEEKARGELVMQGVEIIPGTRSVGTWVDGMEAVVRVEMR